MKIISWNLENIGLTKLTQNNRFSAGFRAFGLGNNVLDYITGLIMTTGRWNVVPGLSNHPADIFVIIELKTGGEDKGDAVSGTCIPTMVALTAMLNHLVAIDTRPGVNTNNYRYVHNNPQVVGYHETVGFIYNDKEVAFIDELALRNNVTGAWIEPRTPYGASFTEIETQIDFNIIGIHAPPPEGADDATRFRVPIEFSETMSQIHPATWNDTFYLGDFNCNPNVFYTDNAGAQVHPFVALTGLHFITSLPNGTLSSTRNAVVNANDPPANYLCNAYDNIIYNSNLPPATTQEFVVDMIGQARNMNADPIVNLVGTNVVALLNNYNKVSDHMPVVIQFA